MATPVNWTAVVNPIIQPATRLVTAITNANPAMVTTSFANQYETGDIVTVVVPYGWGMTQWRSQTGPITVLNTTQFTIPVDSTNFDVFVEPTEFVPGLNMPAMVLPSGEVASKLTQEFRNILGGL